MKSLKQWIPLPVKHRLSYLRHNVRARLAKDGVPLRMDRLGEIWSVTDGYTGETLLVPSFERWHRYRSGIPRQCEAVAKQYRVGGVCSITPDDRVIDIGANVGEFTLYAVRRGGHVLAVEADRGVAGLLLRNIERCAEVDVEIVPVWKADEEVTFYSSPESADSSLIHPDEKVRSASKRMAYSLDTLASRWLPEGEIKLIKCDAEGAEPEVLQGAKKTLERTRWVAIDCGPERQGQPTVRECTALLELAGFELSAEPTEVRQVLLAQNTRLR